MCKLRVLDSLLQCKQSRPSSYEQATAKWHKYKRTRLLFSNKLSSSLTSAVSSLQLLSVFDHRFIITAHSTRWILPRLQISPTSLMLGGLTCQPTLDKRRQHSLPLTDSRKNLNLSSSRKSPQSLWSIIKLPAGTAVSKPKIVPLQRPD